VPLDPLLIEVLACPVDKGPLLFFDEESILYNPRLKKRYEVNDGIPDMLIDDSTDVGEAEHQALMEKAAAGGVPETGKAPDA
jgi:uncharacterized protein YbaR (Trm112 family)